jgi:hypothetical protein
MRSTETRDALAKEVEEGGYVRRYDCDGARVVVIL